MKNLYLFDIDGTLVNIDNIHLDAYQKAYTELLGIEVPRDIIHRTFGMIEVEQHKQIFAQMSIPIDEKVIDHLVENGYKPNFAKIIKTFKISPLEGVVNFLDELKRRGEHIGILSGHTEETGIPLLENSGLRNYFSLLGLCIEGVHKSRADIARSILKTAREQGLNYNKAVVIGDTDSDIRAGKSISALTIAVATGRCSADELRTHNPDLVLNSMKEYQKIFDLSSD